MYIKGKKRVALLGPFGGGNLGDESIQKSMISNLRRRWPKSKIYGVSQNPMDTAQRHEIPSVPLMRTFWKSNTFLILPKNGKNKELCHINKNLESVPEPNNLKDVIKNTIAHLDWLYGLITTSLKYSRRIWGRLRGIYWDEPRFIWHAYNFLKEVDLLIISGGGQLDDEWGGVWWQPYALYKWTTLAKLSGAKVAYVSVGAGPIHSRLGRKMIRRALEKADYRSYRDEDSRSYVDHLGVSVDGHVYPDLAHSYPIKVEISSPSCEAGETYVGIIPIPYMKSHVWSSTNSDIYSEYISKLSEYVQWLIKNNYNPIFMPGDISQDNEAIDDIINYIIDSCGESSTDHLIRDEVKEVEDLISQIRKSDIIVSSRLHGMLLSYRFSRPVIALSYHRKMDRLAESHNQDHYCGNIDEFSIEWLCDRTRNICNNIDDIRSKINTVESRYSCVLDEQYDLLFGGFKDS